MASSDLKVICLESVAFYSLIEEVVRRLDRNKENAYKDRWIEDKEAMLLIGISSKTTLQKYRDEGKIRYSQCYSPVNNRTRF
jgi:hypothetical protein